jgi:hypothetical protein
VVDDASWRVMSLEEKVENLHERLQQTISLQSGVEFRDNIVQIVNALERNLSELRMQTGFPRDPADLRPNN